MPKARKPLKPTFWFDPIYKANFAVAQCAIPQLNKWMAGFGDNFVVDDNGAIGKSITYYVPSYGHVFLIWVALDLNFKGADAEALAVLFHESIHAMAAVFARRGLKLSDKSEEAFTYYGEWIFREALLRLQRKKS